MTLTPEEVLAASVYIAKRGRVAGKLWCDGCRQIVSSPTEGHFSNCPVAALAASQERVRALALYVQGRGHAATCPQATGPYDLDIYMEPACTCGYDSALRGPSTAGAGGEQGLDREGGVHRQSYSDT